MPYAEPAWLTEGYLSPYYNDSHRALQEFMRKFSDEEVYPVAQECEKNGKRVSRFSRPWGGWRRRTGPATWRR